MSGFRYPLRWADERTTLGDFEGRELTVDVFNIPLNEQNDLYRKLRPLRNELRFELAQRIVFVFHSPEETTRHYSSLFPRLISTEIGQTVHIMVSEGGSGDRFEHQTGLHFSMEAAA